MPEDEQRKHKLNPYNKQHGYTRGFFDTWNTEPKVFLGSNIAVGPTNVFTMFDECLLAIARTNEDTLLISAKMYDNEDNLVLEILDNHWKSDIDFPWDVEAKYRHLKIRQAKHNIFLELSITREFIRVKGIFWRACQQVRVGNSKITWPNGSVLQNTQTGGGFSAFAYKSPGSIQDFQPVIHSSDYRI